MNRMLLIRTGGLGDTLLLWPAVAGLRRKCSGMQIDLMGRADRLRPLINPLGADRALDVDGSGLHLLYEMSADLPDEVRERFGEYDLVVVFGAAGDFALAENLSACGASEVHAFLPFPAEGEPVHVADHMHRCLMDVGLSEPGPGPALPPPGGSGVSGRPVWPESDRPGQPRVLIAPGSGSPKKNWPADRFADLLNRLRDRGCLVCLSEGPADGEAVQAVLSALPADAPPPTVIADRSPVALAADLASADLVIGNDSGVIHLAGLMHRSTVAIFGPSDPVRWRPLGPRSRVVTGAALDCKPCSQKEREACPAPRCLHRVDPERVWAACAELLS